MFHIGMKGAPPVRTLGCLLRPRGSRWTCAKGVSNVCDGESSKKRYFRARAARVYLTCGTSRRRESKEGAGFNHMGSFGPRSRHNYDQGERAKQKSLGGKSFLKKNIPSPRIPLLPPILIQTSFASEGKNIKVRPTTNLSVCFSVALQAQRAYT